MKSLSILICIGIIAIVSSGCATLLKGYEDTVRINNFNDSLQIYTTEGIKIPIYKRAVSGKDLNAEINEIKLRSNQNHTLILKLSDKQKVISLYPKLGIGWVFLDLLCGGVPSLYDAYTGNWNKFTNIDASMENN